MMRVVSVFAEHRYDAGAVTCYREKTTPQAVGRVTSLGLIKVWEPLCLSVLPQALYNT